MVLRGSQSVKRRLFSLSLSIEAREGSLLRKEEFGKISAPRVASPLRACLSVNWFLPPPALALVCLLALFIPHYPYNPIAAATTALFNINCQELTTHKSLRHHAMETPGELLYNVHIGARCWYITKENYTSNGIIYQELFYSFLPHFVFLQRKTSDHLFQELTHENLEMGHKNRTRRQMLHNNAIPIEVTVGER